jgi:hypothetical protein
VPARFSLEMRWLPEPALVASGFFMTSRMLEDMRVPMEASLGVLARQVQENFKTQGQGTWEVLEWDTVIQKQRVGAPYPNAPLVRWGPLMTRSPTSFIVSHSGRETQAEWVDPTNYGGFHLGGTKFMPVRDFLMLTDNALQQIQEIFADWIDETMQNV